MISASPPTPPPGLVARRAPTALYSSKWTIKNGKEEAMKRLLSLTCMFVPLVLAASPAARASNHDAHSQTMRAPAASLKEPALETLQELAREVRALRQRVATLEALKPRFTNFMPNYSERFHVMHRAGDAGDWAVAAHEVDELRRLTGISKYVDPKLGGMMQGFMNGNLQRLRESIEHGNASQFSAALKDTVASCNACHQAAGSPIVVSLKVEDTMSMRHPHDLRTSTVPKDHTH